MGVRWDGTRTQPLPSGAWAGPADRFPVTRPETVPDRMLGSRPDHVVRPFYSEPGLIVRWWLCSCGQSIVRVRPRPYPPRHA